MEIVLITRTSLNSESFKSPNSQFVACWWSTVMKLLNFCLLNSLQVRNLSQDCQVFLFFFRLAVCIKLLHDVFQYCICLLLRAVNVPSFQPYTYKQNRFRPFQAWCSILWPLDIDLVPPNTSKPPLNFLDWSQDFLELIKSPWYL